MSDYFALGFVSPVDDYAKIETLATFDVQFFMGKRLANVFPPTTIALRSRPPPPDYFEVGSVLAVSAPLRDFLEHERVEAEFIELQVVQKRAPVREQYYFMNCLAVIPAMDNTRSKFEVFRPESGGGIKTIHELYVDESKIRGRRLFVLEEAVRVLLSSDLVESLKGSGFTGMSFRPLPTGPF